MCSELAMESITVHPRMLYTLHLGMIGVDCIVVSDVFPRTVMLLRSILVSVIRPYLVGPSLGRQQTSFPIGHC